MRCGSGLRLPDLPSLVCAVAMLVVGGAPAARAIDPALCADDGVTEIPSFATGRDTDGCLLVDPGNGQPAIPFQYETFHRTGISRTSIAGETAVADVIEMRAESHGKCRTKDEGEFCSYLIWDTHIDNYLDPAARNDDIWFAGGAGMEYVLVKDSSFANGWKCSGGGGWLGPNGLQCDPGNDSSAHSDGIQMLRNPVNGGWVVFQDSAVLNGHITLFLIQQNTDFPPNGSFLFQGFRFGQVNEPVGAATNWIDDCLARGSTFSACSENRLRLDYDANEVWVVDVSGSTLFQLRAHFNKVVLVNTGCGRTGCGGEVGYTNGWPHPLDTKETGPGSCPNGLVLQQPTKGDGSAEVAFCYTSLEAALSDTVTATAGEGDCPIAWCPHTPPPFMQLSPSGWENPPGGS